MAVHASTRYSPRPAATVCILPKTRGNVNKSSVHCPAFSQIHKIVRDICPRNRYNRDSFSCGSTAIGGMDLKKLNDAVERFAIQHPGFGVPGLMRYIVIGEVIVYLLTVFSNAAAMRFLAFDWYAVLHGELWRLVTFIFMSDYTSLSQAIWVFFFLYLYYMIGTTLEREWGTAKFSLYYLSGVVLTLLTGILASLLTGQDVTIIGTQYVNLSLFFAFAMLYPDMQFLLFLIIPVKVKWLAWLDAGFFALSVVMNLSAGSLADAFLPVIAILNFFVFFWNRITEEIAYRRGVNRHQTAHRTIQFKTAARQQRRREAQQGYRHKCAVCGRTDTEYPNLQFRYCSRCAGYHCFCEEHIFNHEHFNQ